MRPVSGYMTGASRRAAPRAPKVRLTEAQVRWLHDPRPYSHPRHDRTFRALLKKGAVVIDEENHDRHGTGKAGYKLTDAGRAALAGN